MIKKFILPVSLLTGTIIGAGIFSLPFVFGKAGSIACLVYLVFLTIIAVIVHLMYADIIIRNEADHHHRFPGFAKIYLGENISLAANLIIFAALFLTLTAYLVLSVSFADLIVPGISPIIKILFFWILGSLAIFLAIGKAAIFDSITTIITLFMILAIFIFGFFSNPLKIFSLPLMTSSGAFLPFGPILFALLGEAAIPAIMVYSRKEGLSVNGIKKVVIWGTIIPAIFYFLFILGILGLSGKVSQDAVSGLIGVVPKIGLIALGIFGFVSLWDSYSATGTEIKKTMEYEWKIPPLAIALIVIFLPLVFYFAGLQNFLQLVSLIGGILYSLWGLLIVLAWQKASRKEASKMLIKELHPIFAYLLILLFIGGIIYHAFHFFSV